MGHKTPSRTAPTGQARLSLLTHRSPRTIQRGGLAAIRAQTVKPGKPGSGLVETGNAPSEKQAASHALTSAGARPRVREVIGWKEGVVDLRPPTGSLAGAPLRGPLAGGAWGAPLPRFSRSPDPRPTGR